MCIASCIQKALLWSTKQNKINLWKQIANSLDCYIAILTRRIFHDFIENKITAPYSRIVTTEILKNIFSNHNHLQIVTWMFYKIVCFKEKHVSISLTVSSSSFFQVNGYDRDLGFNGDLLYVISNGDFDSVFKIDTFTGELFVDAQLDREATTDYLLNITVQDQGSPNSKAVSKLLHIIIEDVNDNAPQFIKSSFSFFFPENTPKGKA